jgi:hypothetical protein
MNEEQLVLIKYRLKEAEITKEDVDEIFPKAIDFVNKTKEHLLRK